MNQAHYTSLINDETIAVWRQKLSEHNNANTINGVVQILSSAACWNGSFLEKKIDEHFKTSPKIPGIDLNSTRVLFEKLMSSQHSMILEQVSSLHLQSIFLKMHFCTAVIQLSRETKE